LRFESWDFLGIRSLGFGISLELGAWNFELFFVILGLVPNRLACFRCGRVLAALFLGPAISFAGSETDWFARSWTTEDGLPNNTVHAIAQTPDGYLWLGSPAGLARFDGIRFEEFSPTNYIPLPNRGTIVMINGREGGLWMGLDRGSVVYLNADRTRTYTEGLPKVIPNGLAEDADGGLWIAYRQGSLYRIKENRVTAITPEDGLPPGVDICALTTDNKGNLWFAKSGQVGICRAGKLHCLKRFEPAPARLASARAGGVWLCLGFQLYKFDEAGDFQDQGEFHPDRPGTAATCMLEDHEGAVWIGTSFNGLFRHDDSGFQAIGTTHQEILGMSEDNEGNIWVGTFGGGLDRVRRRAISLQGTEAGLPFASVESICQDPSGTIWAVAQNGVLARRINGKWNAVPANENWPDDATCVTADTNGTIWVGTRLHGLYCWRNGKFLNWGDPKQIRGQAIHTLLVSRAGDLWIGEENPHDPHAIQRLRSGELRTFDLPPDSRIVRAMAEDTAGNIWAGTSKGVLLRFTGDTLTDATPKPEEPLSIRCLYTTPDGALWIGYAGFGVGRLKSGRYGEIRTEQGFHDNWISHILSDGHGWLWFGGDRGIFKVRQQELEEAAENRALRVRSIQFGKGDGLPSLLATFGDSPNALRSRDGRLWIPMRTALAVVEPQKVAENTVAPRALLSQVSVGDRKIAWYGGALPVRTSADAPVLDLRSTDTSIRLPPAHRRLLFEFSAPSFTAPENVQFRYRLEPLDEDWVAADIRRSAEYPRLPAGNYVFRVIACNYEGVWDKTGTVLSLVVAPFFWQTLWFRISGLTAFTLAVVAAVRIISFRRLHQRLRILEQQEALHRERARIAKDIHDDVGANLTQIALLGELAQQDRTEPEKAAERMGKISGTARLAIKSLDEIVWAVNPRNDTLAHLIDYAGQFAVDFLRAAGIRCRLDLPEQPPARELSTDLRHNLFLVIKEALNNVAKHAHASEVWLRASVTPQALEVVVEDNGCGFDKVADNSVSDGLRNMRQRMEDIGGQCRIESKPGAGTKVFVHLPWPDVSTVAK
jgi:signal transduction histidine kinase/ligand-binding sensor domain-containing protein